MYILVINSGSSSLKYQLLDGDTLKLIDKGLAEKIGLSDSFLKYGIGDGERLVTVSMPDHHAAIQSVLEALLDPDTGSLTSIDEIAGIGHRVVQGGEYFSGSVIVDDAVIEKIEELIPLGPLHNPPALAGIKAFQSLAPSVPQIVTFDTAFHQSMPAESYMFPLPIDMYEELKVRRYGAHGTSHQYVAERAAEFLGKPLVELRLVTCHLGNGCSITAIKDGKCLDTSMGLTPLDGLMMGTRTGGIDPAIVPFVMKARGYSPEEMDHIMNRQSGLLAISGISNDMRDIEEAAAKGNQRAALAFKMFIHSVRKYIGQYVFELGGVDAIIMTAGIGENDIGIRAQVFTGLEDLGIELDDERNQARGGERLISSDNSKVSLLVIPTNEELAIAQDVIKLIK